MRPTGGWHAAQQPHRTSCRISTPPSIGTRVHPQPPGSDLHNSNPRNEELVPLGDGAGAGLVRVERAGRAVAVVWTAAAPGCQAPLAPVGGEQAAWFHGRAAKPVAPTAAGG